MRIQAGQCVRAAPGRPRPSARIAVRVSAWPPSVVEDVPADRASAPLVVEDKVTHFDRDLIPLPSKFTHPCCLSFTSRGRSAGRPDRVGRGAQVVSRDVSHRHRLPSCECRELRCPGQSTCCGIRGESDLMGVAHPHLAPDPRTTNVDGFTWPGIARLLLLEQRQYVLGAEHSPPR